MPAIESEDGHTPDFAVPSPFGALAQQWGGRVSMEQPTAPVNGDAS